MQNTKHTRPLHYALLGIVCLMAGCTHIYTTNINDCTQSEINTACVNALRDSFFLRRLYIMQLRKDSVWQVPKDTSWVKGKHLSYFAYYSRGDARVWLEERNAKTHTANTYIRTANREITMHQQQYFPDKDDDDKFYITRSGFYIGKRYKILPDHTVLTLQNYDTIYPICWREAMRIAAGTGHLSKKYITDAMVNYPEDDDISRQTLRDSSWAVWKVYTYNRVVYLDAFTGKVTFKGYIVRGYITEPDGGCSAFAREQKEPPKPTPSPSKPKIKRDNWLYYLLLHLHLL